jgi:hypothetical protein
MLTGLTGQVGAVGGVLAAFARVGVTSYWLSVGQAYCT